MIGLLLAATITILPVPPLCWDYRPEPGFGKPEYYIVEDHSLGAGLWYTKGKPIFAAVCKDDLATPGASICCWPSTKADRRYRIRGTNSEGVGPPTEEETPRDFWIRVHASELPACGRDVTVGGVP